MSTLCRPYHPSYFIPRRSALVCLVSALFLGAVAPVQAQVKVFLNGDSITSGVGSSTPANSYPSVLASQLGSSYTVQRDSTSGATLLRRGEPSFFDTQGVQYTREANPDIITIMLGTNDSKAVNWAYRDEFVGDYLSLIDTYRALPAGPDIFPCLPPPAADNGIDVRGSVIANEIIPRILEIGRQRGLRVIDLHSPLLDSFPARIPDGIHPDNEGHLIIATQIREAIIGGRGLRPTPAPWLRADVGATSHAGSDALDEANVLHVLGGGPGVNGSADAFRIVYQPLNGDGEVTARVLGQRSLDPQIATRPDAMAGVMIRDNAGADARQVSVVTTPGNGLSLRWRDSSGGQVGSTTVSNVGAPLWVRVRRTGNTFNGYYSNNGLSWTQIGTGHTVPMSAGTLGGVVAAGGPEVGLTRARFDQVQVTGGSTLPLPPVVAEARPLGARQGWRSAPGSGTYRVRKDSPDTGPFEVP